MIGIANKLVQGEPTVDSSNLYVEVPPLPGFPGMDEVLVASAGITDGMGRVVTGNNQQLNEQQTRAFEKLRNFEESQKGKEFNNNVKEVLVGIANNINPLAAVEAWKEVQNNASDYQNKADQILKKGNLAGACYRSS